MAEKDNPYPDLTIEKLRKVIEDVYNEPHIAKHQEAIDRMYQNMSPEARVQFNDALRAEFNRRNEREFMFGEKKEELKEEDLKELAAGFEKEVNDFNPIYKGKTR